LSLIPLETNGKCFDYKSSTLSISVHTADYLCLASDTFVNDVIIDFYLQVSML
jgi:Ulp1 family protease